MVLINKEYKRLISELKASGISHASVQRELGISRDTLNKKIYGKRNCSFTLEQAITIKSKFFPEIPIEELFKR